MSENCGTCMRAMIRMWGVFGIAGAEGGEGVMYSRSQFIVGFYWWNNPFVQVVLVLPLRDRSLAPQAFWLALAVLTVRV